MAHNHHIVVPAAGASAGNGRFRRCRCGQFGAAEEGTHGFVEEEEEGLPLSEDGATVVVDKTTKKF